MEKEFGSEFNVIGLEITAITEPNKRSNNAEFGQ